MKPPIGLGLDYARYLRKRIEYAAERLISTALEGYNPHRGRIAKADASGSDRAIRSMVKVFEELPPDPAKIEAVGYKVELANAREIKKAGLIVPKDPRLAVYAVGEKQEGKERNLIIRGTNPEKTYRVPGISTKDLGPSIPVQNFREENLSLIRTLDQDTIDRFRTVLEQADREAWRVEDLRAHLEDELGISKRHADLLARDQVLKFNGQLNETRQTAAGITHYTWNTSGDERVRPSHRELDGTVQSWAEPPVVDEKTQRRAHPGGDYQCRCIPIPVVD